jgi:filamentous hemagglutinin family protein
MQSLSFIFGATQMKTQHLLIIFLLIIPLSTIAQITTDGSLGPQLNLLGPHYQITPDVGLQRGVNLFHSFQDFNLNNSESATFSGPNHLQNVISRVTGGNPSQIDGLFRSTIPGADVYFLNPYGIMFGTHAQLDVQGSFHASTADYLRLGENGRFDARNPSDSILTVAPIESFGFLDNPHGKIEVAGRANLETEPRALLQVPNGKGLSLIGGDIRLSQSVNNLPFADEPDVLNPETVRAWTERNQLSSQLYAPSGRLNLVAVQGMGDVRLTAEGIDSNARQGATIQMEPEAFISTTGENGGNVFIRASEFTMDESLMYVKTLGVEDGGMVNIQADNIVFNNGSKIISGTNDTGKSTDIHLSASESIRFLNESPLDTSSGSMLSINQQLGDAGHIHLQAQDVEFRNVNYLNGIFNTDTYGTGHGGDLSIHAENNLNIVKSTIQLGTFGMNEQAGHGGDLYLHANTIKLENEAQILLITAGSQDAGQIGIEAESFSVSGRGDFFASALATLSLAEGHAGHIHIQAHEVLLESSAMLMSTSYNNGDAGDIKMQLSGTLTLRDASPTTGIATSIFSNVASGSHIEGGNAGNIQIHAQAVQLEDGARIDASSEVSYADSSSQNAGNIILDVEGDVVLSGVNPYGENIDGFGSTISARSRGKNAGQAGTIQIHAASVSILDGAQIETSTGSTNRGGDIQIQTDEYIKIQGSAANISLQTPLDSQIDYLNLNVDRATHNQSISGIYAHSSNPITHSGDSGSIEVTTPYLHLSQRGQISTASQGGGKAGQIILNVEKLELEDNALIRSNSELPNQFDFPSPQKRDAQLISLGMIVKTANAGDGRAIYHINLANNLFHLIPITQVANLTELEALPEQIKLTSHVNDLVSNGYIVHVKDAGEGQAARFLYFSDNFAHQVWTKIDESKQVILEQPDASLREVFLDAENLEKLPYSDGTPIHIKDIGNGKAADFIYTIRIRDSGTSKGQAVGDFFRVRSYQVPDTAALQTFTASMDLLTGTQVNVAKTPEGQPARFVFDGADWVRMGEILEVPNTTAREALAIARPGHIVHLPEGDSIYTGREWIDLGQIYRVNTLSEREALNVKHGDLVKVADIGNGRHDAFLYANGQWIQQIRGGDAGQIVINAETIQLSDGSEISTGSISGGGGSITLNVDKMVYLTDSQVSTSVQEGVGNGGDLTINGSQFVIMNNGQIIAQAYEGHGGNIRLDSEQLVKSPCSQISASSKLGIDGNVQVDSPAVDLDAMLVVLSGNPLEAKFPKGCDHVRTLEDLNTFRAYFHPPGRAMMPGDFLD